MTIADDHISFHETYGALSAITYDEDGNPEYHLAMQGEGQSWTVTYLIMLTANGMSIIFETAGEDNPIQLAYHHPDAGCGRVFFLN